MTRGWGIAPFAVALLLMLFGTACDSRVPSEYRTFFAQSLAQQREQFRTLPVEEQLKIYRVSRTLSSPDPAGLWPLIAERGKEAVPALLQALRTEQDEVFKQQIMVIFLSLSWSRYDLRHDAEVLAALETAVASFQQATLKDNAQQYLTSIKAGPGGAAHAHH